MFHEEFFPTPKSVIIKMLAPFANEGGRRFGGYNLRNRIILEPSAGKGDILTYISDETSVNEASLFCCEINPDLQAILKSHRFSLVGEDFLEMGNSHGFDLILMNPPFSNGDEHLLHAWNLIDSGDIVCLLNSETLNNPNTKRRKLLATIVRDHGSIEDIGQAFKTAERKTNVNVSIVRLHKESNGDRYTFFENTEREKSYDLNEETIGNQVARRDVIGNMVTQYEAVKSLFAEYMKLHSKLQFYLEPLMSHRSSMKEVIEKALKAEVGQKGYSEFVVGLNSMAWASVISKTNLQNYMTRQVSRDFETWSKSQGMMAFTEKNIHSLIEMVFLNQTTILEKCLVEAFDLMCRYDRDNKTHWEGWATNDAYKVNRKVILPHFVELGFRDNMRVKDYDRQLDDMDRAMCLLTGKKFAEICGDREKPNMSMHGALNKYFDTHKINSGPLVNNTVDSEFFTIKFFKKGTIHLYFKDEKLWERFNLAAAKGKNWLPAEDKKKTRQKKV